MKKIKLFEPSKISNEKLFSIKGGQEWKTTYETQNTSGAVLASGEDEATDANGLTNNTTYMTGGSAGDQMSENPPNWR